MCSLQLLDRVWLAVSPRFQSFRKAKLTRCWLHNSTGQTCNGSYTCFTKSRVSKKGEGGGYCVQIVEPSETNFSTQTRALCTCMFSRRMSRGCSNRKRKWGSGKYFHGSIQCIYTKKSYFCSEQTCILLWECMWSSPGTCISCISCRTSRIITSNYRGIFQ